MGIAVEWWMKGEIGELLRDAIEYRIYTLENPDWSGLREDALNYGLSYGEVFEFLQNVREEG